MSYENAEHLFSDATNPKDQYFGLEEFQYENDAHDLSELEDSDDSNAENYFENDYADSDPGILFTSEEEDDDRVECPHCKETIPYRDLASHEKEVSLRSCELTAIHRRLSELQKAVDTLSERVGTVERGKATEPS